MLTPQTKHLILAITRGPLSISASDPTRVNLSLPQHFHHSAFLAMFGTRASSSSYLQVTLFMSSRHLPQKCTSLDPNIFSPPNSSSRLDLGCGESLLSLILCLNQPYLLPNRFWLLDTRVRKVVARECPYRQRSNPLTYTMCWCLFRTASLSVSTSSITSNTCLLHCMHRPRFGTPAP